MSAAVRSRGRRRRGLKALLVVGTGAMVYRFMALMGLSSTMVHEIRADRFTARRIATGFSFEDDRHAPAAVANGSACAPIHVAAQEARTKAHAFPSPASSLGHVADSVSNACHAHANMELEGRVVRCYYARARELPRRPSLPAHAGLLASRYLSYLRWPTPQVGFAPHRGFGGCLLQGG